MQFPFGNLISASFWAPSLSAEGSTPREEERMTEWFSNVDPFFRTGLRSAPSTRRHTNDTTAIVSQGIMMMGHRVTQRTGSLDVLDPILSPVGRWNNSFERLTKLGDETRQCFDVSFFLCRRLSPSALCGIETENADAVRTRFVFPITRKGLNLTAMWLKMGSTKSGKCVFWSASIGFDTGMTTCKTEIPENDGDAKNSTPSLCVTVYGPHIERVGHRPVIISIPSRHTCGTKMYQVNFLFFAYRMIVIRGISN